jgi:hypothetical protein
MAVIVEKWADEPIILLKPDAHVTEHELTDAWFRSIELAHGSAHRIVDLSATVSPDTVVSLIRNIVQAAAGAPVSPQLAVTFVGATPAAGSAEMWFINLDDAVDGIMGTKSSVQVKVS